MENFKGLLTRTGFPNGETAYSENYDNVEAYYLQVDTIHVYNRRTSYDTSWLGRMGWEAQTL